MSIVFYLLIKIHLFDNLVFLYDYLAIIIDIKQESVPMFVEWYMYITFYPIAFQIREPFRSRVTFVQVKSGHSK